MTAFDLETANRFGVPYIAVVGNNSAMNQIRRSPHYALNQGKPIVRWITLGLTFDPENGRCNAEKPLASGTVEAFVPSPVEARMGFLHSPMGCD
jgi:hypothetical protein